MPLDEKALAENYAKMCGWINQQGFQVAHADDIAKAMIAFLRSIEAAKSSEQPDQYPEFEVWLKMVCFQNPTREAYDLAKAAWSASKREISGDDK